MPEPTQEIQRSAKQEAVQKACDDIEMAIRECGVLALKDQPAFMQAIRMAYGIRTIRNALTEAFVKENFMPLQGTKLGFLTDKDKEGGYSWDVVRDVLCEAMLRGFRPVNNEFNIIAGQFYGAKNGFERNVLEYPGLQDFEMDLGVPQLAGDKGALVPCEAHWYLAGVQMKLLCHPGKDGEIDKRIPVKVNGGMGADGILGKATRKLYARVYQRLTGCSNEIVDAEPDAIPTTALPAPAEPEKDGRRIKLGGDKKNGEAAPDPVPAATPQPTEAERLAAEAKADEQAHAAK